MHVPKWAVTSPAGFAYHSSQGRWKRAKHLDIINEQILEVVAGRLDVLICIEPPRHGKSELISKYTPAWYTGLFPQNVVTLVSYNSDFAETWGFKARRLIEEHGLQYFGVGVDPRSSARGRWNINGCNGGMNSIGMDGSITGKDAHLLIIDDPVKNSDDADSPAFRERQWNLMQSTIMSRLEPNAGVILVMTRWHQDDLGGRLIKKMEEEGTWRYKIIHFPAVAYKKDEIGRMPGDPLWPWRYSKERLEKIRSTMTEYWWSALYQGQPIPRGGRLFKRHWFEVVQEVPLRMGNKIRYWDIASSEDRGDYSVGTKMGFTQNGHYCIEDVVRGQWRSKNLQKIILQTAAADGPSVNIRMEQEPGASGKIVIDIYKSLLSNYNFEGLPSGDKSKSSRWEPFANQAESGNVILLAGNWNGPFLDEMEVVPSGHDDQADSASGAFSELVKEGAGRKEIVFGVLGGS
jgi:predicted phage terminase large subunit-like protein